MSLHQTEAIVLKTVDFLEYDKLVTLYTRQLGKVRAVAKSVRKPKSKLAGSLSLFARLKVTLYGKRPQELYRLTQAETVKFHHRVRENVDRLTYASIFIELLTRATGENEPEPEVFDLCTNYLTGIEKKAEFGSLTLIYLIKLLQLTGFAPELSGCVGCRKKFLPQKKNVSVLFSYQQGGLVCSSCQEQTFRRKKVPPLEPISNESIQFYLQGLTQPLPQSSRLQINRKHGKQLLVLLLNHIAYHLEGNLKSQKFYQYLF